MCMPRPQMPAVQQLPDPPPPPVAPPPPSSTAGEVVKGKDRAEDQTINKKRRGRGLVGIGLKVMEASKAPGLNIAH